MYYKSNSNYLYKYFLHKRADDESTSTTWNCLIFLKSYETRILLSFKKEMNKKKGLPVQITFITNQNEPSLRNNPKTWIYVQYKWNSLQHNWKLSKANVKICMYCWIIFLSGDQYLWKAKICFGSWERTCNLVKFYFVNKY